MKKHEEANVYNLIATFCYRIQGLSQQIKYVLQQIFLIVCLGLRLIFNGFQFVQITEIYLCIYIYIYICYNNPNSIFSLIYTEKIQFSKLNLCSYISLKNLTKLSLCVSNIKCSPVTIYNKYNLQSLLLQNQDFITTHY